MPGNFPTPPAIPGLEWRTLRPDDAGALLKLALACSRADQAPISHELEAWIETMIEGQSPAGDTLAAEQSGGELAAAAWVTYDSWMIHELRASLNGLVHPGMRGQGLGEFLLTWMEGAALAHFPGPEDLRQRVLRIQVYHQATSALDLFARRGFELAQADEELRCDLRHPLPQFSLPPGFSLYPWIPERANLFYKVYVGAFQDRPGFPNWLEDVWLQQLSSLHSFRPDLSLVALPNLPPTYRPPAGGPPAAAFALCSASDPEEAPRREGRILQMGVHPEYRRLGLGRALLASVLSRFKAEGIGETVIDIGAYNPEAAGLLQSLGFVVTRRLSGYRKLIPQA